MIQEYQTRSSAGGIYHHLSLPNPTSKYGLHDLHKRLARGPAPVPLSSLPAPPHLRHLWASARSLPCFSWADPPRAKTNTIWAKSLTEKNSAKYYGQAFTQMIFLPYVLNCWSCFWQLPTSCLVGTYSAGLSSSGSSWTSGCFFLDLVGETHQPCQCQGGTRSKCILKEHAEKRKKTHEKTMINMCFSKFVSLFSNPFSCPFDFFGHHITVAWRACWQLQVLSFSCPALTWSSKKSKEQPAEQPALLQALQRAATRRLWPPFVWSWPKWNQVL